MADAKPAAPSLQFPRGWVRPMSNRASAALGAAAALVTAVFYFMDAGRSLDYDSSVTVGVFVKTNSVLDPLRRQLALNNHPLFSIIEHVLWSSGLRTETLLRIPPILFGVATVAVIAAFCAKAWGPLPAVSAAAIVATNPMFAELSRSLRGYSLVSLCAVTSTMLLWRLVERNAAPASRWVSVGYVLFLAAGIATHLYGVVVLVVHFGVIIARRDYRVAWAQRWIVALVLGGLVYVPTLRTVLNTRNHRTFYANFPRRLVVPLFGEAHVAIIATGIVVLWALWLCRRRPSVVGGVVGILVFLLFVWVVVQPQFLVFRYLVWLVPGVGVAAAVLVSQRPIALVFVVIAVVAMVVHEAPNWTVTEVPTSELAAVVDAARADGLQVCGVAHSAAGLLAYTRQPPRALNITQARACDMVVGFYVAPKLDRLERAIFPYAWRVPGQVKGKVYSRRPQSEITATMTRLRDTLEDHPRTWPS